MHRAIVVLALFAASLFPGCARRDATRPDVLLITVDTLRADFLGTYGFDSPTSPEIDALAAESVVFERAIAAAAKTAPAHASIMTSRFTRGHSIGYRNGSSTLVDQVTLAEIFQEGGWATGAFVGNVLLSRSVGLDRGFEVYDDELRTPERNRAQVVERGAEETTARALSWLASTAGPALLWVHYQDPHGPYTPPLDLAERFRFEREPDEAPLPQRGDNSGRGGVPAYQALEDLRYPSEYVGRYAGEIFYADRSIGALVRAVDAHAGERGAVVLLTADHGESFGEEGHWFTHTHTTTPEVARVPFVLRAPGLTPERRIELVHHVDVTPTLLERVGLAAPADARGLALGELLAKGQPVPERTLFCDNGNELSAYRGDGFIRARGAGGAWQAPGRSSPSRWVEFRWEKDGGWSPTGRKGPLPAVVREYAATAVPVSELPAPSPEVVEQLRALGYGR